jgi:hypothetical protein
MKARKLLPLIALGLAVLMPTAILGHEAKSKHGGIVRTVSDLHFELVMQGNDAIVFVEDHGKPVSTAGMSGKITVLNGKDTSEFKLQPAGENRLQAKDAKLRSGSKIVASIQRDGAKVVTVRFAVK